MTKTASQGQVLPTHEFREVADFDLDGAVLLVGYRVHRDYPADFEMQVNAGAVNVTCSLRENDVDALIAAFKAVKRAMAKGPRK